MAPVLDACAECANFFLLACALLKKDSFFPALAHALSQRLCTYEPLPFLSFPDPFSYGVRESFVFIDLLILL